MGQQWLDRIKYVPLGSRGSYLSLGGEFRGTYERIQNDNWTDLPIRTNSFGLERFQLHADAHVDPHLRFFVQLQSGLEQGRPGGPRPIDEKRLDFLNAFADVRPATNESAPRLRLDKQQLNFESGRAVAVREGPNVRQGFYGFRVDQSLGKSQSSGFAVRPSADNCGFFNDVPLHDIQFWGLFNEQSWSSEKNHAFDVDYFGLDHKAAAFNRGVGREVRQTLGLRLAAGPSPVVGTKRAVLLYDVEAAYQFGHFCSGLIRAWTISTESAVLFFKVRSQPQLDLRTDVSSGDADPKGSTLETFNALSPIGNYFGIFADNRSWSREYP